MEHVKKIRASCWAHFNAKSLIWKEGKQTPLSYKSSFAFFPNEVRQHHVKNTFLHQPVEYYREVRYDFAGIRITTTFLFLLFSLRCYLSNWVISSACNINIIQQKSYMQNELVPYGTYVAICINIITICPHYNICTTISLNLVNILCCCDATFIE